MTLKAIFPGLNTIFKGDATVKRYYIQGGGEVRLTKSDFKAQGGEGSIYVRGARAYKIYTDPRRAIPHAKIRELSALTMPNIVRPLEVLLDERMRAAGYSMRAVGRSYALCQLFPVAFRRRNNLTPEAALRLVLKMREGVSHVHSKGVLVVDLNEMNFLVAEDFSEVYFIDVDSYQTPSFPAAALMESVRDRHAREFSTASDWFSFAVVSFQTFVGIHPYKGSYPPMQGSVDKEQMLDARMRANVSVLRPEVKVPASCLPFGVIPPAYLDWYRAVFDEGKRLPPPGEAHAAIVTAALAAHAPTAREGNSFFELKEVCEFDDEVVFHDGALTVTRSSVYFGGERFAKPRADAHVVLTPRLRHAVAAYVEDGEPRLRDLTAGRDLPLSIGAEEMAVCGGRLYVKQGEGVFSVEFLELGGNISPGVSTAANVMMKSTRMFEGLAVQNLLGAHYASVFTAPGACHQVRLAELDGYRLIDARLCRNVLLAVGARGGLYDRLVFRFADDFGSYDSRVVADVSSTDINFAVLDTGVVLSLTDEGALELFPRREGARDFKTFEDPGVGADARLFHVGAQAYFARGRELFKFTMRRPP